MKHFDRLEYSNYLETLPSPKGVIFYTYGRIFLDYSGVEELVKELTEWLEEIPCSL